MGRVLIVIFVFIVALLGGFLFLGSSTNSFLDFALRFLDPPATKEEIRIKNTVAHDEENKGNEISKRLLELEAKVEKGGLLTPEEEIELKIRQREAKVVRHHAQKEEKVHKRVEAIRDTVGFGDVTVVFGKYDKVKIIEKETFRRHQWIWVKLAVHPEKVFVYDIIATGTIRVIRQNWQYIEMTPNGGYASELKLIDNRFPAGCLLMTPREGGDIIQKVGNFLQFPATIDAEENEDDEYYLTVGFTINDQEHGDNSGDGWNIRIEKRRVVPRHEAGSLQIIPPAPTPQIHPTHVNLKRTSDGEDIWRPLAYFEQEGSEIKAAFPSRKNGKVRQVNLKGNLIENEYSGEWWISNEGSGQFSLEFNTDFSKAIGWWISSTDSKRRRAYLALGSMPSS